jgi:hypothetical protein
MKIMWKSKKKCQTLGLNNEEQGWESIPPEYLNELDYYKSSNERGRTITG